MDLSFIIPTYNTVHLLPRCLDSIYNQDIPEDRFEVIVVNDGSTDNTETICENYKRRHQNLIYLKQKNQGQGAARNKGLDRARGEFVMFVDSDDALMTNSISNFSALAMQNKVEICVSNIKFYDAAGNCHVSEEIIGADNRSLLTGEDVLVSHNGLIGTACAKLFKREFLKTHHLYFSIGIVHEDVEFMARAYSFANKIIATTFTTYIYYWNIGSTDHTLSLERKKLSLISDKMVAKTLKDLSLDNSLSCSLRKNLRKRCNSLLVSQLLLLFYLHKTLDKDFTREFINGLRKEELYPIKGSTLSFKSSILSYLLNSRILLKVILRWR